MRGTKAGKATSKKTSAKETTATKTGAKKTSTAPSKTAPPKKTATSAKTASTKTATSTKPAETKADFVRARAHLSPKEIRAGREGPGREARPVVRARRARLRPGEGEQEAEGLEEERDHDRLEEGDAPDVHVVEALGLERHTALGLRVVSRGPAPCGRLRDRAREGDGDPRGGAGEGQGGDGGVGGAPRLSATLAELVDSEMGAPGTLGLPGEKRELRVLVDTSSWMHEHAEMMLERFFVPIILESGKKLVVPVQVAEEVHRHLSASDPELRQKAVRANELLGRYRAMGLADVFGGGEKTFADNVIQIVIMRFCEKYHFCLITQDRALAADTLRLGQRHSVTRTKSVLAVRIGQHGGLDRWELDPKHAKGAVWQVLEPAQRRRQADPQPKPPARESFRLCAGTPRTDTGLLAVTESVALGATVVDGSGRRLRLVEKIGAGGEGTVFSTDASTVCKVYEGQQLAAGTRDRIALMLQQPVRHPGICWPQSLAMNERGEFVGYFMERARGKELQRTIFIKPLLERAFPGWTRVQLVVLTTSILESMLALHERNVSLATSTRSTS